MTLSSRNLPTLGSAASPVFFSQEFYRLVRNHVTDGGLFVQWVHLYHIDMPLIASVVKALSPNFEDYAVYALNFSDMAIVARKDGPIASVNDTIFSIPPLKEELAYLRVENQQDVRLRKIGGKRILDSLFFSTIFGQIQIIFRCWIWEPCVPGF